MVGGGPGHFGQSYTKYYPAKTMRKRYEWTRVFLKTRKKIAFSNEYGYVLTGPESNPLQPKFTAGLGGKNCLSRSKLKQAFLIDSDAEPFMYLCIVLGPAHEKLGA